jgi:hypothetical protein
MLVVTTRAFNIRNAIHARATSERQTTPPGRSETARPNVLENPNVRFGSLADGKRRIDAVRLAPMADIAIMRV